MTNAQHEIAQARTDTFYTTLAAQYAALFKTPQYARAASLTTPENLARDVTNSLAAGNGKVSNQGEGVKNTCRQLHIPCTYKGIRAYLDGTSAHQTHGANELFSSDVA